MAPWPEQGNEPKAPDKNSDNFSHTNSVTIPKVDLNVRTLGASAVESMIITPSEQVVTDKDVSSLDENGLKALLDEALAYKNPKDVEGKSKLFKELLHCAETDKKYPESMGSLRGRTSRTTAKKSRRRQQSRREAGSVALDKSADVQDLVHALGVADSSTTKTRGKSRSKTDINSTPNKETASQSNNINDETNSEHCNLSKCSGLENNISVEPPTSKFEPDCVCDSGMDLPGEIPLPSTPHMQQASSVNGVEQSQMQLPTSYNSVKSLVGSGGESKSLVRSVGEASTILYPISMLPIPTSTVHPSVPKSMIEDGKERSLHSYIEEDLEVCKNGATSILMKETTSFGNRMFSLPFNQWDTTGLGFGFLECRDSNSVNRFSRDAIMETKKAIDENGNSLATNRIENGSDRKGKPRRLKLKNDKNTIMSQNIEGHRSDIALSDDLEAVVKYIESPTGLDYKGTANARQNNTFGLKQGRVNNKVRPVRDKSSETVGRKGRRTKENKMLKSNSLEEISKTKLEDLTNEENDVLEKKQTTVDDLELNTDRTWELSNPYMHLACDIPVDKTFPSLRREVKNDLEASGDSEFHIVTKKQRKKKRSSTRVNAVGNKGPGSSGYYRNERGFHSHDGGRTDSLYRYGRSQCDPQRRKSASSVPPSDKSADSSDLDSVHSLPVSSTTKKTLPAKMSTSSGSTPQASYADIARSVASPPRGNSNSALNKPANPNFLEGCEDHTSQSRAFSPDTIPTVVFSLPRKSGRSDEYNENMDKDYPPLDQSNERKVKTNDLFVEYTVYMTKQPPKPSVCVNVEETVVIKSTPCKLNASPSSGSPGYPVEDTEQVPNKRPPVILMNEDASDSSAVNELVFGFEVNQQLLVGCEKKADEESGSNEEACGQEQLPIPATQSEDPEKSVSSPPFHPGFNHDHIVDFVLGEWDSVMNELAEDDGKGRIRFFDSH